MSKPSKKTQKPAKPEPVEVIRKRASDLTDRERGVLKLFARGHTYQEIGDELEISSKTVGSYLQRVREKIRAKTRSELITRALEEGLIGQE